MEEKEVRQPIVERNVDCLISDNGQEPTNDLENNICDMKNLPSPNNTSHNIQVRGAPVLRN